MRSVTVNAPSGRYAVQIGPGLLQTLGARVRETTRARKCAVIAGENVFPLYGAAALESLQSAGLETCSLVLPAGEGTKCLRRYGELLEFLAERRFTRTDCLVALGGGVTGDLTGFAAATYQRGIAFVQAPTTLLAAVDSSVGGKTAIDLPQGKNQVGAFYPARELAAGYAEVIKYAVLGDPALFKALGDKSAEAEEVIETCVRHKAAIVAEDERDTGARRLLNLGHTFGHAVESRSAYTLLHGEAVSVGTAMICRAACKKGLLAPADRDAVIALLRAYDLPTETKYSADELYDTLLLDKKFSGGRLHLIVPRAVGRCEILPVTAEEAYTWLEAGLR